MVTIRVDIFGIYILGWEGVAWINVEDKGMAQINVVSGFIPIFVRPDHPHCPVRLARPTGPYRPLSYSLPGLSYVLFP